MLTKAFRAWTETPFEDRYQEVVARALLERRSSVASNTIPLRECYTEKDSGEPVSASTLERTLHSKPAILRPCQKRERRPSS